VGNGKWWAGFAAAFLAAFVVDHMEKNYGIDFKELEQYGMSAAFLKSSLEGTFVSFFVWVTPAHLVGSVTTVIVFTKNSVKQWRDALKNPN
jgi:hypothetical protein